MPFSLQTSPDLGLEADLPLIDLSQFAQTTHDAHYHELIAKAKHACQEWGFFRVVNHGIPDTLLQDVDSVVRQLCAMPAEAKQRSATENPVDSYIISNGYEGFCIHNPPHSDSVHQIPNKIWPQDGNPLFCKTITTYTLLLADLARTITKIILAILDLDVEQFYHSDFQNCMSYMRINHYTSEGKSLEQATSPSAHTDLGLFTILYTDNEAGLQIRSTEGTWLNVKPLSNSFVINIADSFKAWSNGRLRSAEHRVVQKGWKDRISIAYFVIFAGDKEIWAPPELVDDHHPRRYRPFTFSQYRRNYIENLHSIKEKATTFIDGYAGL